MLHSSEICVRPGKYSLLFIFSRMNTWNMKSFPFPTFANVVGVEQVIVVVAVLVVVVIVVVVADVVRNVANCVDTD